MTHVPVVMNHLIKRLRDYTFQGDTWVLQQEAADAIEALQARVTELEERLDCDRAILAARTASMERYMEERDAALTNLNEIKAVLEVERAKTTVLLNHVDHLTNAREMAELNYRSLRDELNAANKALRVQISTMHQRERLRGTE